MALMRLQSFNWLFAAGLVAGGIMLYQSRSDLAEWLDHHRHRVDGLDQAVASQVYFLETNRWLEFDLPKDTPTARMISNASIPSETDAAPGTKWPYAIEYQLQGNQGRILATGVYHFDGEHVVFLDERTGKRIAVNTYLDQRTKPLSGRRWVLSLTDPSTADARVLRLRLHSCHEHLLEVAIRVYFQSRVPERKAGYRWNRLNEDQKRDLARGNVFSAQGLNEEEKRGLLRYHWLVAAPEGIPGRDFQRRIIYVRDDSENLKVLREWVPSGIAVDAGHCGVLPITNRSATCQLQIFNPDPASNAPPVSTVLSWHGELQQRCETNFLTWAGASLTVLPPIGDGILEIRSSRPVYVRAFQVGLGQTNEVTPEPLDLLTFHIEPANPLEFALEHAASEPTLFRLDLRPTIDNRSLITDHSPDLFVLVPRPRSTRSPPTPRSRDTSCWTSITLSWNRASLFSPTRSPNATGWSPRMA